MYRHPKPYAEPQSDFGRKLREWREAAQLSQSSLSERAGLHASHVSLLELGYAHPKPHNVRRLAEVLEVDYDTMQDAVDESKSNYTRRLAPPGNPESTFPNKTYLPLAQTEWLEEIAKQKGKSKSWVMAMIIMREYFSQKGAVPAFSEDNYPVES